MGGMQVKGGGLKILEMSVQSMGGLWKILSKRSKIFFLKILTEGAVDILNAVIRSARSRRRCKE